jgi:hypothetical protein
VLSSQSCRVLVPEGRWERNSDLVGALMGRVELVVSRCFDFGFAALLRAALSEATVRLIQRPPAGAYAAGANQWADLPADSTQGLNCIQGQSIWYLDRAKLSKHSLGSTRRVIELAVYPTAQATDPL